MSPSKVDSKQKQIDRQEKMRVQGFQQVLLSLVVHVRLDETYSWFTWWSYLISFVCVLYCKLVETVQVHVHENESRSNIKCVGPQLKSGVSDPLY